MCFTMYQKISKSTLCVLAVTGSLSEIVSAGDFSEIIESSKPESASFTKVTNGLDFIKFNLDGRFRYEIRNQQGLDASHAATFRFRPSLTFFGDQPLSFFVESENTFAAVRDYQVGTGQSANFSPFTAGNTEIIDPENHELNQAFVKYSTHGFTAKVGRQRIIIDNAAFIGNVGWRQNEQTFDAASLTYKNDDLTLYYAYSNRVNRIFGTDGTGAVQALEGDVHMMNASLVRGDDKYVGYTYLMDFSAQAAGFPTNASNNTYGGFADLKTGYGKYHIEAAYQTEAGSKDDYDAFYGAASYAKKVGGVTLTSGIEYLGDGFVTPLATVHAFNGFSDAFIGDRLGLSNQSDGISDVYVKVATKVGGVVIKGAVHHFRDESFSEAYGWEADLVAVKPINESTTALAKFAYFFGDDDTTHDGDIGQFSMQLDYKF